MSTPKLVVGRLQAEVEALKAQIIASISNTPAAWMAPIMREVRVFVVQQRKGRARYSTRTATVPLWAWEKSETYRHYYLAHELAHHVAFRSHADRSHGQIFQSALQRLTPWAFYELGYKPKCARAAGIELPPGVTLEDMRNKRVAA